MALKSLIDFYSIYTLMFCKTVHVDFYSLPACFDFPQNLFHYHLSEQHLAVDDVEDGGGLPVWTEKEDPPFSPLPPAVHRWRTASLLQTEGSFRDGPATVPTRSVSPFLQSCSLKGDETLEDCATCILCD